MILESLFGSSCQQGKEYLFFCPACKHHKPKLSVNLIKDHYKCWTCDIRGKSVRRLIYRYGDMINRQRWDQLVGKQVLDISEELFASGNREETPEQSLRFPSEYVSLIQPAKSFVARSAKNYLFHRGVFMTEIVRRKIGYCAEGEYSGRIIIPSFDKHGKLNYFVARDYTNSCQQKYKNPTLAKEPIIFNELGISWTEDVILVEGAFDAIKAGNAIPILGSSLNDASYLFSQIVLHDTPIYIALDPDANAKAMKIIKKLMEHDVELFKIDIRDYRDVGAMNHEEFQKRKQEAVRMTSDSYLYRMLQEA
jgi:DNA primase